MNSLFSKGDMLFNEYQIGDLIQQDAVFYLVNAININSGTQITLQILRENVVLSAAGNLFDYFDGLQRIKRKGFVIPELILQDKKFPIVMVYPIQRQLSLSDYLKEAPDKAQDLWRQASDLLHVLHNQKVVHGLITEDCFSVINGQVQLGKFGYGLLLSMGNQTLALEFKKALPPEFTQGNSPSFAADVYGYAKVVAAWKPSLIDTAWFKKAVAVNPLERYQKMRDVYRELLETIVVIDMDTTGPNNEQKPSSALVPKFRLVVKAEPVVGGAVSGSGIYYDSENIIIEAVPNKGWRFVGWTGDFKNAERVTTIVLTGNKTVVGEFEQQNLTNDLPDEVEHPIRKISAKMIISAGVILIFVLGGSFLGSYYFSQSSRVPVQQVITIPEVVVVPKNEFVDVQQPQIVTKQLEIVDVQQPQIVTKQKTTISPVVESNDSKPTSSAIKVETESRSIDENWDSDARAGIKISNSGVKSGETISWSGGNDNGYANGSGTISYFRGGNLQRQMKANFNQGRLVDGTNVVIIYPDRQVTGYVRNGVAEY